MLDRGSRSHEGMLRQEALTSKVMLVLNQRRSQIDPSWVTAENQCRASPQSMANTPPFVIWSGSAWRNSWVNCEERPGYCNFNLCRTFLFERFLKIHNQKLLNVHQSYWISIINNLHICCHQVEPTAKARRFQPPRRKERVSKARNEREVLPRDAPCTANEHSCVPMPPPLPRTTTPRGTVNAANALSAPTAPSAEMAWLLRVSERFDEEAAQADGVRFADSPDNFWEKDRSSRSLRKTPSLMIFVRCTHSWQNTAWSNML